MIRKASASRRPTLAKLNINFINKSQKSQIRAPQAPKNFAKSASFIPKLTSQSGVSNGIENKANPKSTPASPASNEIFRPSIVNSVQAAGKLFSFKEVALAPPGTIVKAVVEHLPKGSSEEGSVQVSSEASALDGIMVTISKNAEVDQTQMPVEQKNPREDCDNETDQTAEENQEVSSGASDKKSPEIITVTETTVESVEGQNGPESISEIGNSVSSESSNRTLYENEASDMQHIFPLTNFAPPVDSAETTGQLLQKVSSDLNENPIQEDNNVHLHNGSENVGSPPNVEENVVTESSTISPKAEKPGDSEIGKEPTRKLSAAAPPFNPSMIQVFGSIPLHVYTEHGGLLPSPANIAPMLGANSFRRSPHLSATARVPYGPRLSGGYNRSGNHLHRNKPSFPNGEHNGDQTHFSPPRIMNPQAIEFVPGQPWVHNGYTVAPNGYMAPQNGIPFSTNGYPLSPNAFPTLFTGVPETPNGFSASYVESPSSVNVEDIDNDINELAEDGGMEGSSSKSAIVVTQMSKIVQEHGLNEETKSENTEKLNCEDGEKRTNFDTTSEKDNGNSLTIEEKTTERWGDYCDGEADVIEVAN